MRTNCVTDPSPIDRTLRKSSSRSARSSPTVFTSIRCNAVTARVAMGIFSMGSLSTRITGGADLSRARISAKKRWRIRAEIVSTMASACLDTNSETTLSNRWGLNSAGTRHASWAGGRSEAVRRTTVERLVFLGTAISCIIAMTSGPIHRIRHLAALARRLSECSGSIGPGGVTGCTQPDFRHIHKRLALGRKAPLLALGRRSGVTQSRIGRRDDR